MVTFVAHNHSRLITLVEVRFLPSQLRKKKTKVLTDEKNVLSL